MSSFDALIPVIDFAPFLNGTAEEKINVAHAIGEACKNIGFLSIRNHGIDQKIINDIWNITTEYFDQPHEEKSKLELDQDTYPFGYSSIGGEILSAGKAVESKKVEDASPDLKEMFAIGPSNPNAMMPERLWPEYPPGFDEKWTAYYDALATLASQVLRAFSISLNLPENYFEEFITHHASAMRAINYPDLLGREALPGQLRASAHTDYGVLTILKSGGPGLQVSKDRDPPNWVDVPYIEDAFIINLGDLMRRWTNDEWQSTLHRVIVPPAGSNWGRRQSIAFFYNLNKDAMVESLMKNEPSKYPPIIAGDFLMQKHLASMKVSSKL